MTATPSTAAAPRLESLGKPRSITLRNLRERLIFAFLVTCGVFTLAITITIIYILFHESIGFFTTEMESAQTEGTERVSISLSDFFLDLKWAPLLGAEQHFGVWPLVWSTMMVTIVAMMLALPLGLIVAIWLSEYAPSKVRAFIKPVLEILAGIPTVVFGYFALTILTPALQFSWWKNEAGEAWNPLDIHGYNAIAAGLAVGIMCLPIVTSLSEDALRAVPKALREGSFGLGASRFETSVRVVLPAALSGIVAAFLLAFARAVGETMIVALAAGGNPVPLHQIVDPPQVNLPMVAVGSELEQEWAEQGQVGGAARVEGSRLVLTGGSYATREIEVTGSESLDKVVVTLVDAPDPAGRVVAKLYKVDGDSRTLIQEAQLPIPEGQVDPAIEAAAATRAAAAAEAAAESGTPPATQPAAAAEGTPGSAVAAAPAPTGAEGAEGDEGEAIDETEKKVKIEPGKSIVMQDLKLKEGDFALTLEAIDTPAVVDTLYIDGHEPKPLWERALIPIDPRSQVQPMTGFMVNIFKGDAPHGTVEYYSAYAVGATLFVITLTLTVLGGYVRKRFRNEYD